MKIFKTVIFLGFTLFAANLFASDCQTDRLWFENFIRTELGFARVNITVDAAELCAQAELDNQVEFKQAAKLALRSILTDATHIESPLANAILVAYDRFPGITFEVPTPLRIEKEAQVILWEEVNKETTELHLLTRTEHAEDGEPVAANWIFLIKIKSLSDHLVWVVVDRSGKTPTYNYGFN